MVDDQFYLGKDLRISYNHGHIPTRPLGWALGTLAPPRLGPRQPAQGRMIRCAGDTSGVTDRAEWPMAIIYASVHSGVLGPPQDNP